MGERPRLPAVAEDGHRPVGHHLVHEDPDHVPVRIGEVLQLAVHVVWPEDRVVEPEHALCRDQVELDGVLGDPVGVFRLGDDFLGHGRLRRPVHGDRAGEDEALDGLGADGSVDQVDRAENVVRVVEAANEVRQPFGRVGGQMEDVGEVVGAKQLVDELGISDRSVD